MQQVSKSESASGAVEQSYHHVLTLTHLVPWHYASMLLTGTCSSSYNVQCSTSCSMLSTISLPRVGPFSSDTTAASIKPGTVYSVFSLDPLCFLLISDHLLSCSPPYFSPSLPLPPPLLTPPPPLLTPPSPSPYPSLPLSLPLPPPLLTPPLTPPPQSPSHTQALPYWTFR